MLCLDGIASTHWLLLNVQVWVVSAGIRRALNVALDNVVFKTCKGIICRLR